MDRPTIPDSIREQAAQWLVRHEGGASSTNDAAFKAWLARDVRHQQAYDAAERTWRESLLLANAKPEHGRTLQRAPLYMRRTTHIAIATCAVVLVVGTLSLRFVGGAPVVNVSAPVEARTYQTSPGETRTWMLSDGSGLTLMGEGRVETLFNAKTRQIELKSGRARIRVAPGDQRIMAVRAGQANLRTHDADLELQVMSGAGRIDLRAGRADADDGYAPANPLAPGQSISAGATISDGRATDGRRGTAFAVPQSMTVGEAIAVLNQHNAVQIKLDAPMIASKRLSGAFRLDDPSSFARTLAALNGLEIEETLGIIRLNRL